MLLSVSQIFVKRINRMVSGSINVTVFVAGENVLCSAQNGFDYFVSL